MTTTPGLERILTWEGFNGHPLRKDFRSRASTTGAAIYPDVYPPGGGPQIEEAEEEEGGCGMTGPDKPLFDVEEMEINFGPQHPATHGVLRVKMKLDGEKIMEAKPIIGYLHRGTEKLFETMDFPQCIPHTDRMDYVAAATNNQGFCVTMEKLLGITIPPRAAYIRMILAELQRPGIAPGMARDPRGRYRRYHAVLLHLPRARRDPRPLRGVLRRPLDPEHHEDRRRSLRAPGWMDRSLLRGGRWFQCPYR